MPGLSRADHSRSPPRIELPREYNAAYDLIERNLCAGRAERPAFIDDERSISYGALADRVRRFARALVDLGVQPEQRVLLCLQDSIDFPTAFLGCIWAGIVPVPVNTMLTPTDYAQLLRDSRARALVLSAPLWPTLAPAVADAPALKHLIVSGSLPPDSASPTQALQTLCDGARGDLEPAQTTCDDACFWLYSSGSTGAPKGVVHRHASLVHTAELFARPMLALREGELVFSAAKLFFAYGLGNALTYPMALGATALLMAERATPEAVIARLRRHRPGVFCGVPTLLANLLAHPALPRREELALRVCTSAGEPLPAPLGQQWSERFGVDVLDGIGSTEMLHVFLSNQPGRVRHGTTGQPIPGIELRIVDDQGRPVPLGMVGELHVRGPSAALGYWNQCEKTRSTFLGEWTRCGDKYCVDAQGYYSYAGRSDDMLKVGGIYVSPIEVEAALVSHPAVLEAAVVGREDGAELIKPAAYVVLKPGRLPSPELASELQLHVRGQLAHYKYPRWVEFVADLPKTATGKIQRFKLRGVGAQR